MNTLEIRTELLDGGEAIRNIYGETISYGLLIFLNGTGKEIPIGTDWTRKERLDKALDEFVKDNEFVLGFSKHYLAAMIIDGNLNIGVCRCFTNVDSGVAFGLEQRQSMIHDASVGRSYELPIVDQIDGEDIINEELKMSVKEIVKNIKRMRKIQRVINFLKVFGLPLVILLVMVALFNVVMRLN